MNYKTLIKQTQEYFSNPADAEYLIQGLTNKKRHEIYLDDSPVSHELLRKVNELIGSAKPDVPVQYLVHKAYFLSYELYVDERVLIPRFETEGLIMKATDMLRAQCSTPKAILDIGTGSGAIAIALARLFAQAKVIATDISKDALSVAEINIKKYNLTHNINLIQSDVFAGLSSKNSYDLIVANPPYIPHTEIESLSPEIKNYEPRIALDGGKDGFEIIERIIKQAPNYISPNGLLALEIDPRQAILIKRISPNVKFEKDNQGFIRYAFIKHEHSINSDLGR